MPRVSVWRVRMALLYLGLGFTLGALMLSAPILGLAPAVLKLRPLHAEILLVGWMMQLAFGVAYWILPRLPGTRPRGSEQLAWLSLTLLNGGTVAVGLGHIVDAPAGVSVSAGWPKRLLCSPLQPMPGPELEVPASLGSSVTMVPS